MTVADENDKRSRCLSIRTLTDTTLSGFDGPLDVERFYQQGDLAEAYEVFWRMIAAYRDWEFYEGLYVCDHDPDPFHIGPFLMAREAIKFLAHERAAAAAGDWDKAAAVRRELAAARYGPACLRPDIPFPHPQARCVAELVLRVHQRFLDAFSKGGWTYLFDMAMDAAPELWGSEGVVKGAELAKKAETFADAIALAATPSSIEDREVHLKVCDSFHEVLLEVRDSSYRIVPDDLRVLREVQAARLAIYDRLVGHAKFMTMARRASTRPVWEFVRSVLSPLLHGDYITAELQWEFDRATQRRIEKGLAPGGAPPTPPRQRDRGPQGGMTAEERCLAVFAYHPDLSLREIANRAGCDPSIPARSERLKRLRAAHAAYLPRGWKTKEGKLEAKDDGEQLD
jgi:hypothetical protein